ncbi:FAD-dependent pyridine nucleotide-disulfide oxidoreductase [Jeotgalibacillus alimentarius]|uniref:FAD-dependent pyridine nucleotide-disulfide oxidoreductase n=1 Tax=Jeotgalibacillus alimentarius TaxID=135826 RepID=A0A0C2REW9_9BACL|nr:FAD-dependent oxidoreductase [Jeotgalibacillus alimentarius]KIL48775.1 FAD-dependent pyridine nucleotide-disulfide oxidoreductase [Jeotgalibacillus alimentarius]
MERYQAVIIGGGSAGMTAASGMASLGAKVALIEKRDSLGGDCLHFGCVPSKALIKTANMSHDMYEAADLLGLSISGELSFEKVKKRINDARDTIQSHDSSDRFTELGADVYFGEASFESDHIINVAGETSIYADKVVIATGSKPVIPPIDGIETIPYVTNESIFELPSLPRKLGVIGGGTVGLEMAQAFSRLGSEVTVFEGADKLFSKEDQDISRFMENEISKELEIKLNAKVVTAAYQNEKSVLTVEQKGQNTDYEFDVILVAAGRKPAIDSLNLENAGVEKVKGFIQTDATFRTSRPHIFAVGDTINTLPFTHAAGEEAKTVVSNVLFGLRNKLDHSNTPWVTFTVPEVFHLGITEQEANEQNIDYKVFRAHLNEVDRFITAHETRGFVKFITDKKGYILGAHAAGTDAGEWMQLAVFAKKNKMKVGTLSRMVYTYPVKAGAVQKAADVYWREKLFDGPVPKLTKKLFELKYKLTNSGKQEEQYEH